MTDVQNAPTRKGPDKTVLIGIGVGVALALAVGAFFIFRSKPNSTDTTVSQSPSASGFQFTTAKATGISTTAGADQKKINKLAAPVANEITSQLNTLFGEGFINETNWKAGKYETALVVFDTHAASAAQQQIDVLTAGSSAGATYTSIKAGDSHLNVQVLIDKHNAAVSAVGVFTFDAIAAAKDGTSVTFKSKGQFIFANVSGTWKIVSFNVTRHDSQATPTATSSTGSPSA